MIRLFITQILIIPLSLSGRGSFFIDGPGQTLDLFGLDTKQTFILALRTPTAFFLLIWGRRKSFFSPPPYQKKKAVWPRETTFIYLTPLLNAMIDLCLGHYSVLAADLQTMVNQLKHERVSISQTEKTAMEIRGLFLTQITWVGPSFRPLQGSFSLMILTFSPSSRLILNSDHVKKLILRGA